MLESIPKSIPSIYLSDDSESIDRHFNILKGIVWERGLIGLNLPLRNFIDINKSQSNLMNDLIELL